MNIRLAGVGGQGILVASEVLSDVLLLSGYDVKKSEVHGMAQRGGAVNSDVRFGPKVYSPIISPGSADILLAFEYMEALRYLPSVKSGGIVIVSEQKIFPSSVSSGRVDYPSAIEDRLRQIAETVVSIDANRVAEEAGSARSVNIALLGALSVFLQPDEKLWREVITEKFRNKGLDANLKAFEIGCRAANYRSA